MVPAPRNLDPDWAVALRREGGGDDRRLRVVIAGSRELPTGHAPRLLIRFIASLPDNAIVLLRSGLKEVGPFETEVMGVCRVARIAWQLCTPWPVEGDLAIDGQVPPGYQQVSSYIGREGVLHRDNVMVSLADVVLAFIAEREVEASFTGTRHVVDAALAKGIPVYLYSVSRHGAVERVGEFDPDDAWASRVPVPSGG